MSQGNNSKSSLISGLLKDQDSVVKLATLVLVVVGGGGNFWATKQTGELNHEELNKAIAEIHDVHAAIGEALERQKRIEELLKKLKPPDQ